MSEEETKTEENKGKSPLGIILVLFAILAIILGYGLYNNAQKAKDGADTQTAAVSENSSKGEEASQTVAGTSTQTTDVDASIAVELDIDALSKPRILGLWGMPLTAKLLRLSRGEESGEMALPPWGKSKKSCGSFENVFCGSV